MYVFTRIIFAPEPSSRSHSLSVPFFTLFSLTVWFAAPRKGVLQKSPRCLHTRVLLLAYIIHTVPVVRLLEPTTPVAHSWYCDTHVHVSLSAVQYQCTPCVQRKETQYGLK